MKTEMPCLRQLYPRPGFFGLLLTMLVIVSMVAVPESRAEKSKPGANSLMTTQDKAELERQMLAVEERLTNAVETLNKHQASSSSTSDGVMWLGAIFLVVATIGFLRLMPKLNIFLEMRTKATMAGTGVGTEAAATLLAEEKTVLEFAERFRVGPKTAQLEPTPSASSVQPSGVALPENKPAPDPVKEFFASAPKRLEKLRELLQRAQTETEAASKLGAVKDFAAQLDPLKSSAEFPPLLPAWQLATALDGLVKQLIEKPQNLTTFTLHTICGAVDVLAEVCAPLVAADLLADPPIRLLAVDDDPLSRHAVAFALKKALSQPDMAANGDAALALATQIAYDAIFLDVQMPGMNGFELCKKIHETPLNADTPVVFVTCQSDDDARAQAAAVGGEDMIAKPFLIFDITVKSVSLVMKRRLAKRKKPQSGGETKAVPLVSAAAA
jgi:CheY-like chemotaxis protein